MASTNAPSSPQLPPIIRRVPCAIGRYVAQQPRSTRNPSSLHRTRRPFHGSLMNRSTCAPSPAREPRPDRTNRLGPLLVSAKKSAEQNESAVLSKQCPPSGITSHTMGIGAKNARRTSFYMRRKMSIKMESGQDGFGKTRELFVRAETVRQQAREIAGGKKMEGEERKRRLIRECFEMTLAVLAFPFDKTLLQLRALEMLGDIFAEYKDFRSALAYYHQGVLIQYQQMARNRTRRGRDSTR